MIGRLNHVAIAVKDLAAATRALSRYAGREGVGAAAAARARRDRGVHRTAEHQDRAAGAAGRRTRPIAKFLEKNADGGIHHVCYEVDDILAARDRLKAAGRPRAGRRQPAHRRARQARAVPAPEGLQRHARRTRAGLRRGSDVGQMYARRHRPLFHRLVADAVRHAADRRAQPARGRDDVVAGTDPGAPAAPMMAKKLIWTTLAAIPVTALAVLPGSSRSTECD